MKRFVVFSALVVCSLVSFAEPPAQILARSVMDVSAATYDFETIERATVILGSRTDASEPTDLLLEYGTSSVSLKIDSTTLDENGCAIFEASLPTDMDNADGHRFHLTLESDYGCRDGHEWKATAREGYGWCGTMDSTMELVGYPEWLGGH